MSTPGHDSSHPRSTAADASRDADRAPTSLTAPLVAIGLIGGYGVARASGKRALGGVVLAAAGAAAGRTWLTRSGPATTVALSSAYLLAFGLSHPLAKRIGAWPSVLTATALAAGAAHVLADRREPRGH